MCRLQSTYQIFNLTLESKARSNVLKICSVAGNFTSSEVAMECLYTTNSL